MSGVGERARLDLVDGDDVKVKLAYLDPDSDYLPLVVYPGDTLTQARHLYASPMHCQQLLALDDSGWDVAPSFHFGFGTRGFPRTPSALSAGEYIAYWIAHIDQVATFRREGWDRQIQRLIEDGVMTEAGDAQFTADFRETRHNSATPRPGLLLTQTWPHTATTDPRLPLMIRAALRQVLESLGESTAVLDGTA